MGYVIYQKRSKLFVGWKSTERGARISVAAWNRRAKAQAYSIMEETKFNNLYNKQVTVKNMMTGKDVYINAQDVGGVCDPSTERYWSM